jgi:hypothetical protein
MKSKKIILGLIFVFCLLCVFGIYEYVNINDIKFQVFDGTDLKEIISEKSTYNMKIDSTVDNGELSIKVYNDKKILLDKSGSINNIVSISKADSTNVRIELTGKAAKRHIIIKLS